MLTEDGKSPRGLIRSHAKLNFASLGNYGTLIPKHCLLAYPLLSQRTPANHVVMVGGFCRSTLASSSCETAASERLEAVRKGRELQ